MRVRYVTMAFPAAYEAFACSDVRALQRAGVDVSVHSLRPAFPDAAQLIDEQRLQSLALDHNTVRASARGIIYGIRHPSVALELFGWLVRYLWRQPRHLVRSVILAPRALDLLARMSSDRPDVLHLFWGHYPAIVGHLVSRHVPDVVLSVFLGAYDLEWGYGPSAPVARRADVVWTHARANMPAIERLGVDRARIRVCHRGLEVDRFTPQPGSKVEGRVIAVGRLADEKTMADVLRVFARVFHRRPEATLVILGDGPQRPELESLAAQLGIQQAVTFMGRVPQDVVREELARAAVLLYMAKSKTDRLPNVIKEAMASRCCCVVTRTRGIDELIHDGVSGAIVESGDIDAAAAMVEWAFTDRVAATAMAHAAHAQVRDHFDVDRAMGTYVTCWADLLRTRHAAEAVHGDAYSLSGQTGPAPAAVGGNTRRRVGAPVGE